MRIKHLILIILLFAIYAMAQDYGTIQQYEYWGRVGATDSTSFQLNTSAVCTMGTFEFDIGSSDYADHLIGPQYATACIKLACYGAGDSAAIDSAWFHLYDANSNGPMINASGFTTFIKATSPDTDSGWQFDTQSDTSHYYMYPLQVLRGRITMYVLGRSYTTMRDTTAGTLLMWRGR